MRIVTHRFDSVAEAEAFSEGVEWVNDSALELVSDDHDDPTTLIYQDEDGEDENLTIDHRKERITIENGQEFDVDDLTDYRCDECSTPDREVWHRKETP